MLKTQLRQALDDPRRVPRAILRRLVPSHPRFGNTWVRRPDGSITFREEGFVAAHSPAALLARHNFETAAIMEHLGGQRFRRSLEIGCGYGRLTPTFAGFSDEHIAVDINVDALKLASATYVGHDFRLASALELPFQDEQFDLVSTWTVIQHIPPTQIGHACSEIARVLSRGGILLICEETRSSDASLSDKAHTWHRRVEDYERLFTDLRLVEVASIQEIERLVGVDSPGTLMLWKKSSVSHVAAVPDTGEV